MSGQVGQHLGADLRAVGFGDGKDLMVQQDAVFAGWAMLSIGYELALDGR